MCEIERIYCNCCDRLLYIEFDEAEYDHHRYNKNYEDMYECDGLFYCKRCIQKCKKCKRYIEKNENINYCNKCYKIHLLSNTFNNITKNLPLELIYEIDKFYNKPSYIH